MERTALTIVHCLEVCEIMRTEPAQMLDMKSFADKWLWCQIVYKPKQKEMELSTVTSEKYDKAEAHMGRDYTE